MTIITYSPGFVFDHPILPNVFVRKKIANCVADIVDVFTNKMPLYSPSNLPINVSNSTFLVVLFLEVSLFGYDIYSSAASSVRHLKNE